MVPDSILLLTLFATHSSLFKCFVWRMKQWNSFYKLSGVVCHFDFMGNHAVMIAILWRRFKLILFSRYCSTSLLNLMAEMIIVYNMFKEYFTHQTYRTEKRVKTLEKRAKQQLGVDPMNCACEIYLTPVEYS